MAKAKQPKQITYGQGAAVTPGQQVAPGAGAMTADQWAASGVYADVQSSNVMGISYDIKTQTLYVEFLGPKQARVNTSLYEYYNVPEQVAKDMFNASSKGAFVHQRLHPYKYQKV